MRRIVCLMTALCVVAACDGGGAGPDSEPDLEAANWRMEVSVNGAATRLPIGAYSDLCATPAGAERLTEIVRVDVVEREGTVEIAVWVRRRPFPGSSCAGVGVFLPMEVVLASALGDRILVNSGVVPPVAVSRCQGIWEPGGFDPCSPPVLAP